MAEAPSRTRPGPDEDPTRMATGTSTAWPGPNGVVSLRRSAPAGFTSTPGSAARRLAITTSEARPSFGLRTLTLAAKSPPGATVAVPGVIVTSRPGQLTPAAGT